MLAREIMTAPVITVGETTPLDQAARLMLERGIGCLVVVNPEQKVVGILCESDFTAKRDGIPFSTFSHPQVLGRWIGRDGIERAYREAAQRSIGEIMSRPVYTVGPADRLEQVLELMLEHDLKHVPVVEQEKPLGVITPHDLLKLMRGIVSRGAYRETAPSKMVRQT